MKKKKIILIAILIIVAIIGAFTYKITNTKLEQYTVTYNSDLSDVFNSNNASIITTYYAYQQHFNNYYSALEKEHNVHFDLDFFSKKSLLVVMHHDSVCAAINVYVTKIKEENNILNVNVEEDTSKGCMAPLGSRIIFVPIDKMDVKEVNVEINKPDQKSDIYLLPIVIYFVIIISISIPFKEKNSRILLDNAKPKNENEIKEALSTKHTVVRVLLIIIILIFNYELLSSVTLNNIIGVISPILMLLAPFELFFIPYLYKRMIINRLSISEDIKKQYLKKEFNRYLVVTIFSVMGLFILGRFIWSMID